jgi:hypothetical protein
MQALLNVSLIVSVTSSVLTFVQTYFFCKRIKYDFYISAFFLVFTYLLLFFMDNIQLFLLLLLFYEQDGISFFSDNIVPKQLTSEKSLGFFYSTSTPLLFVIIVFVLALLLTYLVKFEIARIDLQYIAVYLCHIIIRVFFWTWKLMLLRKLSQFSLGSRD